MEGQKQNRQHVRHLTLPSGRQIDVVYFEAPDDHAEASDNDLHACGTCGSELVQPLEWQPVGHFHWQVTLRCPNCEWTGTGVFAQADVDRYDAQLEAGCEDLEAELKRLERANMTDEVERFTTALAGGHILPSDF